MRWLRDVLVAVSKIFSLIGREIARQRRNREISEQMAQLRREKELAYRKRMEANETVSTEALIRRNANHGE
jgi:hypothetical protein